MPLDYSIPLQSRFQSIQMPSIMELMQFENQMENSRALREYRRSMMEDRRMVTEDRVRQQRDRENYSRILKNAPAWDYDSLIGEFKANAPDLIPTFQEHWDKIEASSTKVREAKQKALDAEQGYFGSLGMAAEAFNYDPTAIGTLLGKAEKDGYAEESARLGLKFAQDPASVKPTVKALIARSKEHFTAQTQRMAEERQGKPEPPKPPSYQQKDVRVGNDDILAGYDPTKNQYFAPGSDQPLVGARPVPPREPKGEGPPSLGSSGDRYTRYARSIGKKVSGLTFADLNAADTAEAEAKRVKGGGTDERRGQLTANAMSDAMDVKQKAIKELKEKYLDDLSGVLKDDFKDAGPEFDRRLLDIENAYRERVLMPKVRTLQEAGYTVATKPKQGARAEPPNASGQLAQSLIGKEVTVRGQRVRVTNVLGNGQLEGIPI